MQRIASKMPFLLQIRFNRQNALTKHLNLKEQKPLKNASKHKIRMRRIKDDAASNDKRPNESVRGGDWCKRDGNCSGDRNYWAFACQSNTHGESERD